MFSGRSWCRTRSEEQQSKELAEQKSKVLKLEREAKKERELLKNMTYAYQNFN
jgi:hypothetical protein